MTEVEMLKVDLSTAHINHDLCGNSFGVPCANGQCVGTAYGSHPYNNIASYCFECQKLIKHAHSKKSTFKKAANKFRGYSKPEKIKRRQQ